MRYSHKSRLGHLVQVRRWDYVLRQTDLKKWLTKKGGTLTPLASLVGPVADFGTFKPVFVSTPSNLMINGLASVGVEHDQPMVQWFCGGWVISYQSKIPRWSTQTVKSC